MYKIVKQRNGISLLMLYCRGVLVKKLSRVFVLLTVFKLWKKQALV